MSSYSIYDMVKFTLPYHSNIGRGVNSHSEMEAEFFLAFLVIFVENSFVQQKIALAARYCYGCLYFSILQCKKIGQCPLPLNKKGGVGLKTAASSPPPYLRP